jgi:Family of unknown function (DUF6428)
MTLSTFLSHLHAHPDLLVSFALPAGNLIPAHFHVTEVGHVRKVFVDCGGTRRTLEHCLLQTWIAEDLDHRLPAEKLATIFRHADGLFPDLSLPVEIEYEGALISQFPVTAAALIDGSLRFQLGTKHTDCLAKDLCLPGGCALPETAPATSCCTPGGACC